MNDKLDLHPCYLEIFGIRRYEHSKVGSLNIVHIVFRGNYVKCSSREFLKALEKLKGREKLNHYTYTL